MSNLVSPLGFSVHGISQRRILEWVAISFSRGSSQARDQTRVSYVSCIGRQVIYHCCHLGSPLQIVIGAFSCAENCPYFSLFVWNSDNFVSSQSVVTTTQTPLLLSLPSVTPHAYPILCRVASDGLR